MKIADPHDHFFKTVFTDKENAIDFVKGIFPENIKNTLKISTLKISESSFIDSKLKEHLSDVVYECETAEGNQTYITILFEHKSFVPLHPHIQLLRYLTGIWELQIKQKRRLTPVIPVIVYHGKDEWKKNELKDSFPEYTTTLFPFIPSFNYLLIDISELSDYEIKDKLFTQTALRIGLLIQKNIFYTEKLRKHLNDFLMLGKLYYREERGIRFLESLLRYLSYASDITYNDIEECTRVLPEPGRKVFMTLAEQLIEQGVEQGIEQGIEQGMTKGIEQGVTKGIEKGELIEKQNVLIKQISRKFGISDMERAAIKETENLKILDDALDIILFAEIKAEVMEAFL